MARLSVQPGAVIDGFTIGECVHSGGMATLWSVSRLDIAVPLLMKIPLTSEGEDPAAIVSFEMEQMILPRLSGPHVPASFHAPRGRCSMADMDGTAELDLAQRQRERHGRKRDQ